MACFREGSAVQARATAAGWSLCLLLALCAITAWAQAPSEGLPQSRYQRTAQYLHEASGAEQADFAAAALGLLVEVYMAEADLARTEARDRRDSEAAGLRTWALAVDRYANQLLLVLDDLEQGFPLTLQTNREGAVSITVADRMVMLSHPRPGQQGVYEQQVLADFCGRHDCIAMTAPDAESPRPITVTAGRVSPSWTFDGTGAVCSHQGLQLRFGSTRQLAALRDLCAQLMQELSSVAVELAWQQRHGVAINWAALDIVATPGRPGHVVHLNLAGDSVLVTVPLLAASDGLLADVVPWLRARASGQDPGVLQLDAESYGWLPPADQDGG